MLKKILIVEDEEMLLDTYSEVLSNSGFEVLKASDGYKGLDMLEKHKDDLDGVILDLMMPGLDGLEVLKLRNENKEKYSSSPVLVLTNMSSERIIKDAFDLGAISYLIKNEMNMDSLVKEVEKVLEK